MIDKFRRGRHTDFSRKLTPRDVLRIRELRAEGFTSTEIARRFHISRGHARGCASGRKWPKLGASLLELPLFAAQGVDWDGAA